MLGNDFYANRLNADAQAIYAFFLNEFISKRFSDEYVYRYPSHSPSSLNDGVNAISALSRDHPEFFFLSLKYSVALRENSLIFTGLTVYSRNQIQRLECLLDRELSLLTNGVMECNEWERERVIYSRVASRYQYRKHNERHDYNIVGLLLREEGVCSAYANMFILALRKAGIACHCVSGGGHAWVMVYVNGIPLHCDVTWESHQGENDLSYSYFNLTDDEISRDHVFSRKSLPQSCFRGYGYHRKNHCCFSTAKDAARYIRSSLWRGDKVIRLKTDCRESINSIVKKCVRQMPFGTFHVSVNEKQGTAIILRE